MGLFDKFTKRNDTLKQSKEQSITIKSEGNSISIGDIGKITIGSAYVGSVTGSSAQDFYVYEWFIKNTGEIFYVGKGRGDRYKEYHEHAYEAEKIRAEFETDSRFVGKNLSEEEALELETKEMSRILNETDYVLTNRITPYFTKRQSGHTKSLNVPPFKFETSPVLYTTQIDEHYFGMKCRDFDEVDINSLKSPAILDKSIQPEEYKVIYGNNYEKYYSEVVALLEMHGSKLLKTKYAKSVSAWIYPFEDFVINYDIDEEKALERIGRRIPVYHLIDVWKSLIQLYGEPKA